LTKFYKTIKVEKTKIKNNKGRKTKIKMREKIKKILKPRIKLQPGTRLTSLLFIGASVLIAAGILIAANIYYNIDTGEVVMEEVQRVTKIIRATAGLIVGGSATQNPDAGFQFQVVGQSKLATTTVQGYLLSFDSSVATIRFATSSSGFYVGFKAPTNLATTTIYTWPTSYPGGSGYVLTSDTSGNLNWTAAGTGGIGDITAVGDVASGDAFVSTAGTQYGNILWFHPNANYTMALTAASGLTANATTIIPAVSGQNYLVLTPNALTSGQVLLATGNYTLGGNSALTFSGGILSVGTSGTAGQIRIYNSSGNYLGFAPTSTASNVTYYWPPNAGSANQVLTTDGVGNLIWSSVQGVGGITGSGVAGQVAFFNGTQSITGSNNFTWSTSTNTLTITGALAVSGTITGGTFTGPSGATTTITSASGQNILLDPATGKIYLGSGDYIVTAGGYEIGKAGTQILREMVPIMGFDLPVRTANSGTVTISRTIQSYPFSACAAGTTRVHKLVIRYGSMGTTTWQVATSGGAVASFTLPPTNSTSSGTVFTAQVAIPTPTGSCTGWSQTSDTDDWWINISPSGNETMIYQIFLAAYDEIL